MGSPVVAVDEAIPHYRKPVPKPAVLTFSPANQRRKLAVNKSVASSPSVCEAKDLQPVPTPVAFQESSTLGERLRIAKEMCVLLEYSVTWLTYLFVNPLAISESTLTILKSF